jgi:hypothetical protein
MKALRLGWPLLGTSLTLQSLNDPGFHTPLFSSNYINKGLHRPGSPSLHPPTAFKVAPILGA